MQLKNVYKLINSKRPDCVRVIWLTEEGSDPSLHFTVEKTMHCDVLWVAKQILQSTNMCCGWWDFSLFAIVSPFSHVFVVHILSDTNCIVSFFRKYDLEFLTCLPPPPQLYQVYVWHFSDTWSLQIFTVFNTVHGGPKHYTPIYTGWLLNNMYSAWADILVDFTRWQCRWFCADPEEMPSSPVSFSNSPPHLIYSTEKVRESPTPVVTGSPSGPVQSPASG